VRFQTLRRYWKKRAVRVAVAVTVFAAAAIFQYRLANIPLLVEIADAEGFAPATVRLGQDELVIEGLTANSADGYLLAHEGNSNEIVDINFERARLSEETIAFLKGLGLAPPAAFAPLGYTTIEGEPCAKPADGEACRPFVKIKLESTTPPEAPGTRPIDIHFFQLGSPGSDRFRYLEMRAEGADLDVEMNTAIPAAGLPAARGCQKLLRVGDWKLCIPAPIAIKVKVASDSGFRLHFRPLANNPSFWGGPVGLIEPFILGSPKLSPADPEPFQAQRISIRSLRAGPAAPAFLSAGSAKEGSLLDLYGLKVGSDQLQVSVSGQGWVKMDGKDLTVDLFERAGRYPIVTGLLTTANAALLGWILKLIFSSASAARRRPRKAKSARARAE
jgi:hypothetical protein